MFHRMFLGQTTDFADARFLGLHNVHDVFGCMCVCNMNLCCKKTR